MTAGVKPGPEERAFTLVEVLVALLIASAVLLGLGRSTLSVIRANRLSEESARAAALAQRRFAELRADVAASRPIAAGTRIEQGMTVSWNVPGGTPPAGVIPLHVTVSWSDGATHTLEFDTFAEG